MVPAQSGFASLSFKEKTRSRYSRRVFFLSTAARTRRANSPTPAQLPSSSPQQLQQSRKPPPIPTSSSTSSTCSMNASKSLTSTRTPKRTDLLHLCEYLATLSCIPSWSSFSDASTLCSFSQSKLLPLLLPLSLNPPARQLAPLLSIRNRKVGFPILDFKVSSSRSDFLLLLSQSDVKSNPRQRSWTFRQRTVSSSRNQEVLLGQRPRPQQVRTWTIDYARGAAAIASLLRRFVSSHQTSSTSLGSPSPNPPRHLGSST